MRMFKLLAELNYLRVNPASALKLVAMLFSLFDITADIGYSHLDP